MTMKIGSGAAGEKLRDERRLEIRSWTRDDVKRHLTAEGTLRDLTIFVPIDVLKAETTSEVLPSFGAGQRRRIPLIEALHVHKIDGNALLDFSQADLMRAVGIHQLGMAKAVLRVVATLCDPQHIIPDVYFNPVALTSSQGTAAASKRLLKGPENHHSEKPNTSVGADEQLAVVKYSSLDPFSGWEKQMHRVTADAELRQRSKSKFELGRMFGRDAGTHHHDDDDFETQRAIAVARDELSIILTREAQEADASNAQEVENKKELELGTEAPKDTSTRTADGLGSVAVLAGLEAVVRMPTVYSAGILEAERRLTELRANYRSIVLVVGSELSVRLVADGAARCWNWGNDDEGVSMEAILAAVESGRAARRNSKHRQGEDKNKFSAETRGITDKAAGGIVSKHQRPASATTRPPKGGALLVQSAGDSSTVERTVSEDSSLTRNDFICLVQFLTDHKEPAEFDQLLAFFSAEYGKDRIENVRRQQAAQLLFRKLDQSDCGFVPLTKVSALVSQYCAQNNIQQQSSSRGDFTSLSLTGKRKRSSASSTSRPSSAPSRRLLQATASRDDTSSGAPSPQRLLLGPASSDRPTSASSSRGGGGANSEVEVDEALFSDFVVEELTDMKSDQFDNVMMQLRVIVEHMIAEGRPFRSLSQHEFEDAVVQGTTVVHRSLVIILSSSVDPSVFVQSMFSSGQKMLRTAAALHRQVADPSLICAPAIRQAKLVVCCVDGELSMKKALESISSSGMERGNWIFVDCPVNTLDPSPKHVAHTHTAQLEGVASPYDVDYLQIALDEFDEVYRDGEDDEEDADHHRRHRKSPEERNAEMTRNGMMNIFLRQAARLILSKSSLSIHRSFRLFVRCPLDKLDDNNIPQIARSIGLILPLRIA